MDVVDVEEITERVYLVDVDSLMEDENIYLVAAVELVDCVNSTMGNGSVPEMNDVIEMAVVIITRFVVLAIMVIAILEQKAANVRMDVVDVVVNVTSIVVIDNV